MPRPHFTPGKDLVPIVQEAGWAPGLFWTGGKSRPHRDSIPDRPVHSQSLYRLSYPAHGIITMQIKIRTCLYIQRYLTPKKHSYLVLPRASADCPFGNSNMQMTSGLEHRWNDTHEKERRTCTSADLSTRKSHIEWSGKDLPGEGPMTNYLNQGTSIKIQFGLYNKYHLSSDLRQHRGSLRKTN